MRGVNMTTETTWPAREQVDLLKKRYENMYRFPEAELRVKNGSTVISVTCAIHGGFEISLDDTSDVCLCKKCSSFFYHLMSTSDKQKAFETMREIYSFAFDNRRLVDRFRKTTKNNHNNMNVFYTMFKEAKKAKEEAEPVVVHQTVNNTNDGSVLQRKYRTYQDALADLNALYDNTLVFPKIQEEYEFVKSDITTICPIHGETVSSFVKMYWTKSACRKCLPLRRNLKIVYGTEMVFEKMLEQYRKAKDNPDYVEPSLNQLQIEAGKVSITTINDFDRVTSDIINQYDEDSNSVSEMFFQQPTPNTDWLQDIIPVNLELPKPAVTLEQFVKSTLRQPTPTVDERSEVIPSTRKRVDDIVAFFNNLNLNDIVKLHADIDLETDEETLVLSLKSGQTIKIC
jgi:hypothetical protein